MFRVEVFVDDKRLSQLLHSMAGVILGEPKIQPVVNAKVKNGAAAPANSGDVAQLFLAHARKHKLTEIGPDQMKKFALEIGAVESSYSHFTQRLKALGVLKKKATRGNRLIYSVAVSK